jgi:Uncharacterised nucleotidyltransferase
MRTRTHLCPRGQVAAGCPGEWTADRPHRRSLEALQRTLSRTTEVLASELAQPGTSAPAWSEAEWAIARAVAAMHGVSPLLAATLRWRGPDSWTRFLEAQAAHTAQRFLRIQRLLQLIDDRAHEAAIPVVPLKGAALHALGIYSAGERPMADVDLLVREEQSPAFAALLAAAGFTETLRTWKHRVFARAADREPAALGEHADNGLKIELHCRIAEALPRRLVDVTATVFPEWPRPGCNSYPSKAALLLHLLLHAAGALVNRELRLIHLHDIARLAAVLSAADWEELSLRAGRAADRSLWWAFPPLALANRYYGCVSDRVLQHATADCHWALKRVYRRRTLAESSFSHLWISAFPGIEWTRSLGAMLAYAAARVVPDSQTLQRRKVQATLQPRVSGGSWSQLSQGERVARWMLSRQARHETLQPVRAALIGALG